MSHSSTAGSREGRNRHLRLGGAGLAAVVATLATAASAGAAGTIPANTTLNEPPAGGVSVLVFSVRDFVSTAGFTADDRVTVNVIRDGVPIGTATALVPQDDPKTPEFDGIVEVNHPGGGCWETSTPDILPGDVVRTTITANAADPSRIGIADQTFTQDVTAGPATSAGGGTIVVHGFAKDALTADHRFPTGELESRIVANKDLFNKNGRRTLRAALGTGVAGGDDGDISYDNPFDAANPDSAANFAWTATYKGLDAADVTRAVGAESRGMWLGRNPAALTENTVYENGQVGGPTAPCTAPATTTAITGTSITAVNAAFVAAPKAVTVSGVAEAGVTGGSVNVPGGAAHAIAIAPSGTWTATIPASELVAQADGPVTISASFAGTPGIRTSDSTTISKDTVAPAPPAIDPATGIFADSQLVHLGAEPGATIRFTSDGSAPTAVSPQFTADFLVTTSRTIRAVAIDAAGNMSAASAATVTIDRTAPVSDITAATAAGASLGTVTAATSASFTFGVNEPVQKTECRLDGGSWVPCTSPKTYNGLGLGQHTFSVRATDLAGNLELSPPVWNWTVAAAGSPQAPPPAQPPAQPPVQQIIVLPPVGRDGGSGVRVPSGVPALLRLTAVGAPRSVKLAAARKGVRISMRVPSGATSVRLTLRRGGRTVSSRVAAVHAGAVVLRVKVAKKGSYRLTLTPLGASTGVARTVAFTVR